MLKLYNAPHSTCSQKVRICLHEKGLPFEDIKLDLGKAKDQLKPEYLALNPNGVVPTLVDDGEVVIDSSVICEYLDEKYPAPKLTPDNIVRRAKMRAWMRYFEEVPTVAVRVPSFNMGFLPRFAGLDDEGFRAEQSDVRPIRKHFYRRMTQNGFKRADVEAALEQIDSTCARMEKALETGPWLLGEQYTIADVVVTPSIDRMNDLGFSSIWHKKYPRVTSWYARMRERPAFQKAFYKGTRMSETFQLSPAIKD
jgi:glutathione S-transferase